MAKPVHQRVTRASGASKIIAFAAALAGLAGAAQTAAAASFQSLTQDQVLKAVEAGRLAPLDTVLGAVRGAFETYMIDVRALEKDGLYLFEILMLEADGAVLHLYYDGGTAALVAWTGVGAESDGAADGFVDSVFAKLADAGGAGAVLPPKQ